MIRHIRAFTISILGLLAATPVSASGLSEEIDTRAAAVAPRVLAWRRDIHQHPELSNRERRTADLVARELRRLGLEVRTGVAHTGVVGVLRGAAPGPVVALRADMDALPVTEEVDLPFASKVRTEFAGQEVGVMHACGHDTHTAMLLGAAGILAGVRERLPGTVVFLFQPAEERPPPGEDGGAKLMIAEGALADPKPEAIFALHSVTQHPVGTVAYRSGGAMASSDRMAITVRGRGTHAAYPWRGVDPIAAASRLVLALQAIPGRQLDARLPAVVSIGAIHGGVRHNVIPDAVELQGTVRSLDPQERRKLHRRIERETEGIARATGTEIELTIDVENGYPVTVNDPTLTRRMLPTVARVAPRTVEALPRTGAEDFAFYAEQIPGLYLWLGIRPPDVAAKDAAPNHSSRFFVDERALPLGTRLLAHLAVDYLTGSSDASSPD